MQDHCITDYTTEEFDEIICRKLPEIVDLTKRHLKNIAKKSIRHHLIKEIFEKLTNIANLVESLHLQSGLQNDKSFLKSYCELNNVILYIKELEEDKSRLATLISNLNRCSREEPSSKPINTLLQFSSQTNLILLIDDIDRVIGLFWQISAPLITIQQAKTQHAEKLLRLYAYEGKHQQVETLIKARVNINCAHNSNGRTPLHWAMRQLHGHGKDKLATIKLLLDYDANPHAEDNLGKTPLNHAQLTGFFAAQRLFNSHNSEIQLTSQHPALDRNKM